MPTEYHMVFQELRSKLADSVDQHQHQLSALQEVHRQTVSSLKSGFTATIDQLKKQLTDSHSTSKG
jgi:hypothetical protein